MSAKVKWGHLFPASWKFVPSKRLFPESKRRAGPDDEQLTASQDWGVIPQKEFIRRAGRRVVEINQHLDMRKRVERDDFVISMRSFQGGLERAWAEGGIRSSYVVLKPSSQAGVGYFARLFKCEQYIRALQATAHFIRDGQDLNYQNFCLVDLPLPPKDEQTQIARFLDYESARIDTLIAKQQQLIALLKEKRQAVISHALTRGLNPNTPLRDSGVVWLGMVPAHWASTTLKRHAQVIDCKHVTAEFVDDGIPLASIGEVKGWEVNLSMAKKTTAHFYELLIDGGRQPCPGDILFTRNATVGEAALVPDLMPMFAMGQDVCLIRCQHTAKAEFVLHYLKSRLVTNQLELAMIGSTFKRVNVEEIRNLAMTLPPRDEQERIVTDLGRQLPKHNKLIESAEAAVVLLQERRTALISAAVTGRIDVRGWVPPKSKVEQEVA